jgi:putative tricarboxylic transport membrane protein
MDFFTNITHAFSVIFQPMNLLFCFIGCVIGVLVGVLPGLGPPAAIALLMPSTFHMSPVAAIIMLAGIYYGAMYGGSTTSILVNIPGEAASVVTCLDGYQMARQGKAGPALGISAFGSFIAGTIATVLIMMVAPPLANFALKFGPPEYFCLMLLGLTLVTSLGRGSLIKGLMMAAVGIFLGTIGTDIISGQERFTYGSYTLLDGLSFIPVIMGLFGIPEVLEVLEGPLRREIYKTRIANLLPNLRDWKDSIGAIIRGSFLGFFVGVLPGGGPMIASLASYATEKRISRHPEKFGTGVIEGVAAPEAANNAASQGAFIPLLALGVPGNATMAVLMGALLIHGIKPGPFLINKNPDLFWGVIGSMYVGNLMLLVLNLPLIRMWVQFLKIPYPILFPLILLFTLIGSYSVNNNIWDVFSMLLFGIIGYMMKKFNYEGAPLILALVLSPLMENALRQSLILSHGSFGIFFTRPIALVLFVIAMLSIGSQLLPGFRKKISRIEG